MTTNVNYELARYLWLQGFSVIPLLADGKQPARKWKRFQNERCSVRHLIAWFVWNDFVPAIVTGALSGITVIDCDNIDAIDILERDYDLTNTLTQATKLGRHFVFAHTDERNTAHLFGQKIDRRGEGGYIKAYPDSRNWTRSQVVQAATLPADLQGSGRYARSPRFEVIPEERIAGYEICR